MSDHEFAGVKGDLEVGWQVYVEALLMEKQRALDAALAAQKEAVLKAEVATERIAARAMSDQQALREEIGERLAALRRELESATQAQKEAVLKAEVATEKRFEGTNEWRAQSADRERSQQEQMAHLAATFMPREVADATIAAIGVQVAALQSRMDTMTGRTQGTDTGWTRFFASGMLLIALLAVAITMIAKFA